MEYFFVLITGLIAGTLGGIVGTGTSIMLVPVLIYAFGPKEAVPIMAIAAVFANASRIVAWWREVDWKATAAYGIPSVPAAALGARTLLALPSRTVDICIALFMLVMIPLRHWLMGRGLKLGLWHLALAGAVIGYVSGIVASTGPVSVPVFLAYGLTKGAFLATEAASSLFIYFSKAATFRAFGALPYDIIVKGLLTGSTVMLGAFIAKPLVVRIDPNMFRYVLDGLMAVSALAILWAAFTAA